MSKDKTRYGKLQRLKGLMKEYDITVEDLSKEIGRAISTISKSNNGITCYDWYDMVNIQKSINARAARFNRKYTIDEIFYS